MIALDIECTGLDFNKSGIWQIGAVDLETGEEFLKESRIDEEDIIFATPDSKKDILKIIGKTEEELRDKKKQSQKEMLEKFFEWVSKRKEDIFLCANPQFDLSYIWAKARKYGILIKFQFRAFDIHTIAQVKYFGLNKKFKFNNGKSEMGLSDVCKFCGIDYVRKYHNALEDSKLTGECFYRLIYGKSFFKEYMAFEIPSYLKQQP